MANIPGFESIERIKKTYSWFDLNTKKFSKESGYCGGIPLMYDSNERRLYVDSTDTHSLVYGSTGSLKTRTIVSPTIKVLGYAGESMIINDPKGELYNRHAGDLRNLGYNLVEINFRDPSVGNSWNPLFIPFKFYLEGDYDKAAEFANDIANNLMLSDRSSDDPFWDYSASDLLYGLIMLTFRYCKDHNVSINAVNISNLLNLRRIFFASKQQARNSTLWKYASEDELVAASLSGSVYAPNDTMNSILSVFDQHMRTFTIQPTLMDMMANNDFALARKDEYNLACKVLEIGLNLFPKNVNLLASLLQYGINCGKKDECKKCYKTMMKIPYRRWTWRGFVFLIDYIKYLIEQTDSEKEINAKEEEIRMILAVLKSI